MGRLEPGRADGHRAGWICRCGHDAAPCGHWSKTSCLPSLIGLLSAWVLPWPTCRWPRWAGLASLAVAPCSISPGHHGGWWGRHPFHRLDRLVRRELASRRVADSHWPVGLWRTVVHDPCLQPWRHAGGGQSAILWHRSRRPSTAWCCLATRFPDRLGGMARIIGSGVAATVLAITRLAQCSTG